MDNPVIGAVFGNQTVIDFREEFEAQPGKKRRRRKIITLDDGFQVVEDTIEDDPHPPIEGLEHTEVHLGGLRSYENLSDAEKKRLKKEKKIAEQ